jgi:autotransporter-associated beta strand protein
MKVSKVAWTMAYLLISNVAFAATFNWVGMDKIDPHDWIFHENWAEDETPTALADIVFPASSISYNPRYQMPLFSLTAVNSMTISSSMEYRIEGDKDNPIPIGGEGLISIDGSGTKKLTLQYLKLTTPTTITSYVSSVATPRQLNFISGEESLTISSPAGGSFLLNNNQALKGGVTLSSGTLLTGSSGLGSGKLTLAGETILKPTSSFAIANDISLSEGRAQIDTQKFDLILNGTIDGHHLIKNGVGELRFSMRNTYEDTTVNAGSIGVTSSGALGTGILTLNKDTSLVVRDLLSPVTLNNPIVLNGENIHVDTAGGTFDLGGIIDGDGLIKLSSGKLILSGANTYTGTTHMKEGILGVKHSSALGTGALALSENTFLQPEASYLTLANDILLDGDGIQFDMSEYSPFTLSGVIDGPHLLNKIGAGTLVLSGAHTFSGGTNLTSGTIELSHPDAKLGSGALLFGNGTTLHASADVTLSNHLALNGKQTIHVSTGKLSLSGNFSGGAGLTKAGAGVLELDGNVTGSTNGVLVAEGLLAVHGALISDIDVAASGILSGTGIITGNVLNAGKMAPGASVGTLTVVGNYQDLPSSIYESEISLVSSDLFKVQGNMSIGPNTTFQLHPNPETGVYVDGMSYTVIDTTGFGTVTGSFTNITTTAPLITSVLTYSDTQVFVKLKVAPVTTFVGVGNGGSVAAALTMIGALAYPGVDEIFNSLSPLSEEQKEVAFNQMHPALYKGMAMVQENNSVQVRSALSERVQVILNKQHCSPSKMKNRRRNPCHAQDRNIHFWVSAVGDLLHQADSTFMYSPQIGYQADSGGFVSGIDYNFATHFYVGALGAYTHSDVKWKDNQGTGEVGSGYAGLYLSAIGKIFYGNFSVMGAWSDFDERRNILYTRVSQTARNSHQGEQIISHLDTGINLGLKGLTVRPFDSLDWIVQRENAFVETGAREYNLEVKSTRANMLRNELGVNFAACHCFSGTKATIDTKFGWVREVRMSGESMDCKFDSTKAPVIFAAKGYFPNRNLLSAGASISVVALKDRFTCTLYYNGEFGLKYSNNGLGGQLNLGF